LLDHIQQFDQISPFAYEVDRGRLVDRFKKNQEGWQKVIDACRQKNVKLVPTIFWTNSKSMHNVLSCPEKRGMHINQILKKIDDEKWDGININYERVQSCDRSSYLDFVNTLGKKLKEKQLLFFCSIGGRTGDCSIGVVKEQNFNQSTQHKPTVKKTAHTTVSLYPGSGKDAQEYKKTLTSCFDQIHIMGYDEWGIPCRRDPAYFDQEYYVSHSSNQWIEQIIKYALSYIPPEKLILSIPTYGLELVIFPDKQKKDLRFKKVRNVTYPTAMALAKEHGTVPRKTAGGELSFTYKKDGRLHYVCFLDAQSILDKIKLAEKFGIKGIYIFKIDGAEDANMWQLLADLGKKEHSS